MVTHVTCFDITGHSRDELSLLRDRAVSGQQDAATILMEAVASFIDARVPVPRDLRLAVASLIF